MSDQEQKDSKKPGDEDIRKSLQNHDIPDPLQTLVDFARKGAQSEEDRKRLEEVLAELAKLKAAVQKTDLTTQREIGVALPAGGEVAKEISSPVLETLQEQIARATSPIFHGQRQEAISRIDAENRAIRKRKEKGMLQRVRETIPFQRRAKEEPQYRVTGRNTREAVWTAHIERHDEPIIAEAKLKYTVRRSGGFVELDSLQSLEEHLKYQDAKESGSRADYTVEFNQDGPVSISASYHRSNRYFSPMSGTLVDSLRRLRITNDFRIFKQLKGTTQGDGKLKNVSLKMNLNREPSIVVGQDYEIGLDRLNGMYVLGSIGSVFHRQYTTILAYNIDEKGKGRFWKMKEDTGTTRNPLTRPLNDTLRIIDSCRGSLPQHIESEDFVGLIGGVTEEIPHTQK